MGLKTIKLIGEEAELLEGLNEAQSNLIKLTGMIEDIKFRANNHFRRKYSIPRGAHTDCYRNEITFFDE